MKIEKTLSNKIYVYSFIMTMAIVTFHVFVWCFKYVHDYTNYPYESVLTNCFYKFCETSGGVALGYFFCLSAFLLYYGCDSSNAKRRIKKRLMTLMFPFLFWNIFSLIVFNNLKEEICSKSIVAFLEKFFLSPFDGPLWYIIPITFYLLFVPVFLRMKKYMLYLVFAVGILCSLGISCFYDGKLKNWEYWVFIANTVYHLPAYLFGIILACDEKLRKKLNHLSTSTRILFLIGYIVSLVLYMMNISAILDWFILKIHPFLLWFCIKNEWFSFEVSKNLKFTFLIYATHFIFKDFIQIPIRYFGFKTQSALFVFLYINLFLIVLYLFSFILFHILDKILPKKAWLFITGGR